MVWKEYFRNRGQALSPVPRHYTLWNFLGPQALHSMPPALLERFMNWLGVHPTMSRCEVGVADGDISRKRQVALSMQS